MSDDRATVVVVALCAIGIVVVTLAAVVVQTGHHAPSALHLLGL